MDKNEKEIKNFKKIENFFQIDLIIKNLINNTFPNNADKNNPGDIISYVQKLSDTIDRIELLFLRAVRSFELGSNIEKFIENTFKKYHQQVFECGYNYDRLEHTFIKIFASMSPELVRKVNEDIYGYSCFIDLEGILAQSTSITEILHVFHTFIINNENILRSSMVQLEKGRTRLYGEKTQIATSIFDGLDNFMADSEKTILSISDNHIIIMLRDFGHATTLDINIENKNAWIEYFIPKVCNYLMVNSLPGIRKIEEGTYSPTAKGMVVVKTADLPHYVNDFIKKIPTDEDMFKKGGLFDKTFKFNENSQTFIKDLTKDTQNDLSQSVAKL